MLFLSKNHIIKNVKHRFNNNYLDISHYILILNSSFTVIDTRFIDTRF